MRVRGGATALLLMMTIVVLLGGCSVSVTGTPAPDAAAGAAAPLVPSNGPFDDARRRFGLLPPTGWLVDTSGARGTAAVFLAPTPTESSRGPFTANINVLVLPQVAELPATVDGARLELTGLAGYVPVQDEALTLNDGTPAHLLGGTFTDPASGFALHNLQLFTVHASSTVVVTGTSLTDSWDVYATALDAALRTVTVAS